MIVDCARCAAPPTHCDDCVITALLGAPPAEGPGVEFDGIERVALVRLADAGLLPPLRLVHDADAPARRSGEIAS